ncbi:MAG: TonB family protein [Gammaproteobacteria bacterium]|nr:TonB family protein [Gammaproteobacteria bacterium]
MPIDPFKTQVLLLHSEQSTLDELGSSFNDRYTVHFATSGTQALSALAETPINVLISAQDLPGMTGLEALQEAKKRSPDMIGILLTGNDEDGNEALVGEEEVFQVVRGNLTRESLLQLVDSATKKIRLATLSESANDTRALAGDSDEHIVMETADNGLPMSTSSSGRMPALDPATLASFRPVDVLVLTRDEKFLQAVEASSRGLHTVHSAVTLNEASAVMTTEKIGVAVIDAAIAGHKVEHLTHQLQKNAPRLVTVVAGRRDDGDMLMDLINRGKVYRFLMKPVTPGRTRLAVEAAVRHHIEAPDTAFNAPDTDTEAAVAPPQCDDGASGFEASPPDSESSIDDDASVIPDERSLSLEQNAAAAAATGTPVTGSDAPDPADKSGPSARSQKLAVAKQEAQAAAAGKAPGRIAIGAAAVVFIASAWLWFSRDAAEPAPPVEAVVTIPSGIQSDFVVDEPVAEPDVMDLEALLASPRAARDAGAIYEPPGSSAIELYQSAVMESEFDPLAVAELDAVISEALALAETALLESRLDDAELALLRVNEADAENARLPFLSAQLQQARLLEVLGDARAAIADKRLRDAAGYLEAAEALQFADRTEIDAVAAELDRASSAQSAARLLALADARLDAGDLLTPPRRNARYYYERVLSNDRGNQAARQGLDVIAGRLILQARASIDSDDFANAEKLLGEAKTLDPQNAQLLAATEALGAARESALAESALAERAAAEQRSLSASETGDDGPAQAALPADAAAAESTASQSADNGDAESSATPVAVSSLERTRYVAPKYPRSAQRRNLSGWVDIAFTVDTNGMVKDIEIRESAPDATFDNAAMRAVEKWEFEPVLENGAAIEQRAAVRMMFALE